MRALILAGAALLAVLAPSLATAATPVPAARLVPITAASYPFGAADHQLRPENLAAAGYVEEEYIVVDV